MPTDTFFNLSDEKRERIIDAALKEFANRSYHKSRITAIADDAGIAKGSFYQYFEGKKDLFGYIMKLIVKKKFEYINQDMMVNQQKYEFFELLREMYVSGFRFAKDNPKLVAIGNKVTSNKDLLREIWGENKDQGSDFFKQLLEVGLAKGELEPSIDKNLISKILTTINYSLVDIIYKDGEFDLDDEENIMETIDEMIDFIKNGIKLRD